MIKILDLARAMAEPITGFAFDELTLPQQNKMIAVASDTLRNLEGEPLDPMRGVDFPFADNH